MYKNFVLDCLEIGMSEVTVDDYIEYWHTHETNMSLCQFLGFTDEEYCAWLKSGNEVVEDILYCRRRGISYSDYINTTGKIDKTSETEEGRGTVTRAWKVYGCEGHRQGESFEKSDHYDFSDQNGTRVIEVDNSDKTGTNEYAIIRITRNTAEECEEELNGQLSDGVFENYRIGLIEEIGE